MPQRAGRFTQCVRGGARGISHIFSSMGEYIQTSAAAARLFTTWCVAVRVLRSRGSQAITTCITDASSNEVRATGRNAVVVARRRRRLWMADNRRREKCTSLSSSLCRKHGHRTSSVTCALAPCRLLGLATDEACWSETLAEGRQAAVGCTLWQRRHEYPLTASSFSCSRLNRECRAETARESTWRIRAPRAIMPAQSTHRRN